MNAKPSLPLSGNTLSQQVATKTASIACRGLIKSYGGGDPVIRDFNLEVEAGEFVVFLGPSGCGKTTILRMIAGLEDISGGDLLIGDRRVNDLPSQDRNIAMVFQNYALYPHMNVFDNIAFGLRRLKLPKAEIERRVHEVSEVLTLGDYLDRKPSQLSGGQQQRVAIARATSKTPEVFLFDEPLSNLDAKLRQHMRVQIARLHQTLRATTIYVTHDQLEAMTLADRIVLMRDGKIEQVGTPRAIFDHPVSRYVAGFIGTPAMNFFDARVELDAGDPVLVAGGARIPFESSHFAVSGGQAVEVGLRPSHLSLVESGGVIHGVVNLTEYLGNDTLVTITFAGSEISVLLPSQHALRVGAQAGFVFVPSNLHLFDKGSGRSLLKNADEAQRL